MKKKKNMNFQEISFDLYTQKIPNTEHGNTSVKKEKKNSLNVDNLLPTAAEGKVRKKIGKN